MIPVAPQRRPALDVSRLQPIGPDDGDLMTLEHPVEPASLWRRNILGHPRTTPHLIPQMNKGGIPCALIDLIATLRKKEFVKFVGPDCIGTFAWRDRHIRRIAGLQLGQQFGAGVAPARAFQCLNGLGYRNLVNDPASLATMHGRLEPFVFHANWTVGLANKRALMSQTGTWLLGSG
jgi:hypothetical protein